jgi:hypothetical protein
MTVRPILFSAPMVRALLHGTKTQTRRVLRYQPQGHPWETFADYELRRAEIVTIDGRCAVRFSHYLPHNPPADPEPRWNFCPYGAAGDWLWVRETWHRSPHFDCLYRADFQDGAVLPKVVSHGGWRPSVFMPRSMSRITLQITGVRVEQLQDISEADALSEGTSVDPRHGGVACDWLPQTARDGYRTLWGDINGAGSWDANPWVWVIQFERIKEKT